MIYKLALLAVAISASASASFLDGTEEHVAQWIAFKTKFAKRFHDESEEKSRFATFVSNLKEAVKRQALDRVNGGTATHGVTKFSDLTIEEFRSLLGSQKPAGHVSKAFKAAKPVTKATSGETDWRGTYTTPVKNQGQCGSCWAFSATEQIESDAMRTLGWSGELAPEQVTDCADKAYGCGGGWTEVAYTYVRTAGGIEQESDYPYTSGRRPNRNLECTEDSSDYVVTVDKFYKIDEGSGTESAMADYMESTGPLSVCVDADTWSSYTGGVVATSACGTSVDHCVQAVGVDRSSSTPYWRVRNSWGEDWGDDGTILLAYGGDTCAIASDATYTAVSLV